MFHGTPFAGSNPALTTKSDCVLKITGLQPIKGAWRYNIVVANIPKVPREEFEAVIKALLNTPPMPANAITDKRPRKEGAKRPGPQKRGM